MDNLSFEELRWKYYQTENIVEYPNTFFIEKIVGLKGFFLNF